MNRLCFILLITCIVACHSRKNKSEDVVAKVYDFVLTQKELKAHLLKTNSVVDSLKATEDYIQKWSKQKLLYRNALINLKNTEDLDKMVSDYKEDLYVSYYKNALVDKKLDTLVFRKEIETFYKENKENFKLNETLVKLKYIHVNRKSEKRAQIKALFESNSNEDKQELLSHYQGYQDYYFNDSTWVSLNNIYSQKSNFPKLSVYDLQKNNKLIEKKTPEKSTYYLYIKEIVNKGDIAPLEYIEPTIKNILLHKNKLKFFNQMEQILIDDAVKQKEYEVY